MVSDRIFFMVKFSRVFITWGESRFFLVWNDLVSTREVRLKFLRNFIFMKDKSIYDFEINLIFDKILFPRFNYVLKIWILSFLFWWYFDFLQGFIFRDAVTKVPGVLYQVVATIYIIKHVSRMQLVDIINYNKEAIATFQFSNFSNWSIFMTYLSSYLFI